ncbi:MAG: HNH endonuclease [Geobacteraceae bacterium]|nr:HNH endonuclease [Geobacteraceae bacterium]
MPKSSKTKLAYQKAYNASPEQKALGVERRRERRHEIAAGKVAIGDGKDIAHKVPASAGGKTVASNLKVEDAKTNRDWRKGRSGYKVGVDK